MKRTLVIAALAILLGAPAGVATADHWYREGRVVRDNDHHHGRGCGHWYVENRWVVDVRPRWNPAYHHCRSHDHYTRWCRSCRNYAYYWKLQHHPRHRDKWNDVNWRRHGRWHDRQQYRSR